MAQVKVRDAFGQYNRVVFQGTQEDAERYVRDTFPRIHTEPGTDYGDTGPAPDAVLVTEDGEVLHHAGPEVGFVNPAAARKEDDREDAE